LGKKAAKIIELIKTDPKVTINELSDMLTLSRTAIINNVNKLKDRGIIERIGPAKGGYWKITDTSIDSL
jgi:ATP-dependent DNA helicase RecG